MKYTFFLVLLSGLSFACTNDTIEDRSSVTTAQETPDVKLLEDIVQAYDKLIEEAKAGMQ